MGSEEAARQMDARVPLLVFCTHLLAAVAMLVVLRHGLPDPATTWAERLDFVRSHLSAWWVGWLLWQLAALSLLALYVTLGLRWRARRPLLVVLALMLAAAAFGADVGGQSLYMGMPAFSDAASFAKLEIVAALLTGYVGNGLYTVAGLLLTVAGLGDLPRRIVAASFVLWSAGFGLAGASLGQSILLQQITTGLMLASLFVWTLLLWRWLRSEES